MSNYWIARIHLYRGLQLAPVNQLTASSQLVLQSSAGEVSNC